MNSVERDALIALLGAQVSYDYIEFTGNAVAPSSGHTRSRITADNSKLSVYLPPGDALRIHSNLSPIFELLSDGTINLYGTRQIAGISDLGATSGGTLYVAGGLYVGGGSYTPGIGDPGAQHLGLHFGLKDAYWDGRGGRVGKNLWGTGSTLNHPYLGSPADQKTGKVKCFAKGKYAEFLIKGGGAGTGICTITELHNDSGGTYGLAGSGATFELTYNTGSNIVSLVATGPTTFSNIPTGMAVDIFEHG